jgi:spermidine synthase
VARIAVEHLDVVGTRIGFVYLANTIGSILGSLGVGFLLLPRLGVRGAFLALIAVNASLGVALAVASSARSRVGIGGLGLATVLVAFALIPPNLFEDQFARRFGILRFYREEVTDTVMVTEAEDGSRMIRYADGRGTAGTATVVGDRMYGHLPLLLHPRPRNILQITFGVGNSLSSVLQHPVERVVCVELSPGVVFAAPFFSATNRNSIEDPRVDLITNDGRNFLLTSRDRYDVIRLDPPELHTRGIVNLYTREFFVMARDHLAEDGIFSIWFNNVMTPEPEIKMLLRTALDVFPHVSIWHDPYMFSWIINGSVEPHDPNLDLLEAKFAQPAVRDDLASIGVAGPYEFLAHFVFEGDALAAYAGEGPLVVDDHTRLDFSVPRSEEANFGIANYNTNQWLVNLMEPGVTHNVALARFGRIVHRLAGYKQPVLPYLAPASRVERERELIQRRLDEALTTLPVH